MTTIAQTIADLRAKAAAATPMSGMLNYANALDTFAKAANPQTILALLDHIAALEANATSIEQATRERCKAACDDQKGFFFNNDEEVIDTCIAAIDALPKGE